MTTCILDAISENIPIGYINLWLQCITYYVTNTNQHRQELVFTFFDNFVLLISSDGCARKIKYKNLKNLSFHDGNGVIYFNPITIGVLTEAEDIGGYAIILKFSEKKSTFIVVDHNNNLMR